MGKYSTIQQHQPLRIPQEWSASERRFVAQLEEVLDDIYRRFGRLTLEDLGGVLKLQARNTFKVESGGAVQIDAKDGANSFLRLGDGNFNVTQSGDVSARTGDFADNLAVGSKPVWHSGNAIVSTSPPKGHGILWICPSETQTVRYAYPTGPNRNINWHNTTRYFDLVPDTTDTMLGNKFVYTLTIPLYEVKGTNRYLDVNVSVSRGDAAVVFPEYEIQRIVQWELQTIRLTVESNINLASSTDPLRLAVTINGDTTYGLYLQRDMEITLQIRSDNTGGEAQPCSIHWIP